MCLFLGRNSPGKFKVYFHTCFVAYIVGLVATVACLHIYKAAQVGLLMCACVREGVCVGGRVCLCVCVGVCTCMCTCIGNRVRVWTGILNWYCSRM